MKRGFVIAIVGAESTGKTQLAQALQAQLVEQGQHATSVGETLREFCDKHGRTPRADEQATIAAEQTRRIAAAAAEHGAVVADTTALMTAVYSDYIFGDASLHPAAAAAHRGYDLTLLTALDLPWRADGLQRDGAHVREPVDALIRAALLRMGQPFVVVAGSGAARLAAAWRAVQQALGVVDEEDAGPANWQWRCEHCGDPDCERRLLLPRQPRA